MLFSCVQGPKLLATFCCGCKEGDNSSAMDDNASALDFQIFKFILQGLADCVVSHGSGLLVSSLMLCLGVGKESEGKFFEGSEGRKKESFFPSFS